MSRDFKLTRRQVPPRGRKKSVYPWERVKPGRPLLISARKMQDVSSTAYAAAKRLGVKFTLRKVAEGVEVHLVA